MIVIGCDHAALEMKNKLVKYLQDSGREVKDLGCYSEASVNYPDYGEKVALEVVQGNAEYGIVICGTGLGISMAASKVPGTRVALCTDITMARLSREHNNANILALGARVIGQVVAEDITETFLTTGFLGGRHGIRVDMLAELDKKYKK